MNRIERLYSDISRLGRETEMLDAVIIMLSDELMQRPAANDQSQYAILTRFVEKGFALADAVNMQTGHTPNYERVDITEPSLVLQAYRDAHQQLVASAGLLPTLPEDAQITHGAVKLRPAEVIPQRIAETVLAHEDLLSAWSIEEADPDSVLDAVDAMLRRLQQTNEMPTLTLETEEGDKWLLAGGGSRVYGDREDLALWLSRGEPGNLEFEKPVPAPPIWA